MITRRTCKATRADGQPCGMAPQVDSPYCWTHDPANAKEADEARRLGGLRRRKEGTVAGAYDYQGLATVPDIRRSLEIAMTDALSLDNTIARVRAIGYLAGQAKAL